MSGEKIGGGAPAEILDDKDMRTEAYLESEQGQREVAMEKFYDDYSEYLDEKVAKGEMTKEEAEKQLGQQLETFDQLTDIIRDEYKNKHNPEDDTNDDTEDDPEDDDIEDDPEEDDDDTEDEEKPHTKEELEKRRARIKEKLDKINKKLGIDEDEEEKKKQAEKEKEEAKKEREKKIKELSEKIDKLVPELAELYARNRRLFNSKENKDKLTSKSEEYEKLLDEYMRLKVEDLYKAEAKAKWDDIQSKIEAARNEIEVKLAEYSKDGDKTEEEIEAERFRLAGEMMKPLNDEYAANIKELETNANAEFLKEYLAQQDKLKEATIDKLDNGTLCRKFISKVLKNKALKVALTTAAVAGLAVTGVGLAAGIAAGTTAVTFGYTAAGVAAGAAKGALSGTLMSRQDSKNSAVRGFVTEEEVKKKLEEVNLLTLDSGPRNVASWLMDQYKEANETDKTSNRKRTLISAGIGAALGAAASGIHVNDVSSHLETEEVQRGYTPTEVEPTKFGDVNIPKGHGAYDTFTQMGGDPKNMQKALDIMYKIDAKYGLSPGSNGEVAGFNGVVGKFAHTYPGPIDTWPDVAQTYIKEVAQEWAKQGLVPGHVTGGEPIIDIVTKEVNDYIPNAFMNFLTRATAYTAAGAAGNMIGNRKSAEKKPQDEGESGEPEPEPVEPGGEGGSGETPTTEPETPEDDSSEAPEEPEGTTEDNPEDSDEKPEETTEEDTTSEESGENQETEEKNDDYKEYITSELPQYIGNEGVEILTSEAELGEDRFQSWWDGLDGFNKIRVSTIVDLSTIGGTEPDWGKSFRTWFNAHRAELLSREA